VSLISVGRLFQTSGPLTENIIQHRPKTHICDKILSVHNSELEQLEHSSMGAGSVGCNVCLVPARAGFSWWGAWGPAHLGVTKW